MSNLAYLSKQLLAQLEETNRVLAAQRKKVQADTMISVQELKQRLEEHQERIRPEAPRVSSEARWISSNVPDEAFGMKIIENDHVPQDQAYLVQGMYAHPVIMAPRNAVVISNIGLDDLASESRAEQSRYAPRDPITKFDDPIIQSDDIIQSYPGDLPVGSFKK